MQEGEGPTCTLLDGIEQVGKELGSLGRDDAELMGSPAIETSNRRFCVADFVKELGPFDVRDREWVLLQNITVIFPNEVSEQCGGLGDVALVDVLPGLSNNLVNVTGFSVNDFGTIDDFSNPLEGRR